MPERVIVYIDGFNLYFGLKANGWRQYYWLDLVRLAENLLKPGQTLVRVNYFTSRISYPQDKQVRQATYLDALSTLPKLSIIYGKYQSNTRDCPHCHTPISTPNEKMTDVNIAVELLGDAFLDRYDMALLISGDSDLTPPITKLRTLFPSKRLVVAFPPDRQSKALKQAAEHFPIGRGSLSKSQLPDEVITSTGFVLRRPQRWK